MIRSTQTATALVGAMLCVLALCCSGNPAVAGPEESHGRAYVFRGVLGLIFSRGMDQLTERIQRAGITANVYDFTTCKFVADDAIKDYRRDPAPIILIGHSMGGHCALKFAETLQDENIPVSLVVTVDPVKISPDVPLNVERYINIFMSDSVLGGGDVRPEQGFKGHYASFDLARHREVNHVNIDKMDVIHEQLVAKIKALATTPAKTQGDPVSLHCLVPANAAVDLWDSGMPVSAVAGDSLKALAAFYKVPLWSLAQINKLSANASLTPGQRIVVPRYLLPPAAASTAPAPRR